MAQAGTEQRTYHALYDGVRTIARETQRGYYAVRIQQLWVLISGADPNLTLLGDIELAADQKHADGPLWMRACMGGNRS